MKKHYVYLVETKDSNRFKVGRTSQQDPRQRLRSYISHNPDTRILGFWNIPSPNIEKSIYYALIKAGFKPVQVKGQKEWFTGTMTERIMSKIVEEENTKYSDYHRQNK